MVSFFYCVSLVLFEGLGFCQERRCERSKKSNPTIQNCVFVSYLPFWTFQHLAGKEVKRFRKSRSVVVFVIQYCCWLASEAMFVILSGKLG